MSIPYKKYNFDGTPTDTILKINSDGTISHIPNDPNNTDRQKYLEWVAEGNTPAEAAD